VPDGRASGWYHHDPAGITVRRVHDKGTIALRGGGVGPASGLAAAAPADTPAVQLHGDPAVFRRWLNHTQF